MTVSKGFGYVQELFVAFGEKLDGWLVYCSLWQDYWLIVQALNGVLERRAVALFEQIAADLDDSVGADCQEESVERCMMQSAERYAVADDGLSLRFRVGHDVGCIKQFAMSQTAEGALIPIGPKHEFPERALVKSRTRLRNCIFTADFGNPANGFFVQRMDAGGYGIVYRNRECELIAQILDDEDGPERRVSPLVGQSRGSRRAEGDWPSLFLGRRCRGDRGSVSRCNLVCDRIQQVIRAVTVSRHMVYLPLTLYDVGHGKRTAASGHAGLSRYPCGPLTWHTAYRPVQYLPLPESTSEEVYESTVDRYHSRGAFFSRGFECGCSDSARRRCVTVAMLSPRWSALPQRCGVGVDIGL